LPRRSGLRTTLPTHIGDAPDERWRVLLPARVIGSEADHPAPGRYLV
jgi:hypothetical protein